MLPVLIIDTVRPDCRSPVFARASHVLLAMVGQGRFAIGLTAALVLEYEAVCMRSLDAFGLTAEDVGRLLDYLCLVGKRAAVRFRVRPSLPDPADEMVLEAAVVAGARWIVTHNVRQLVAGAARFGIEVLTPGKRRGLGVGR